MTTLVQVIRAHVVQANENYAKLRARVAEKAATANNGKEPTIDCYGRLHAPCDGYFWEDTTYQGGAYLPFSEEFYEQLELMTGRVRTANSRRFAYSVRLKSTTKEIEELSACIGNYGVVERGRIWDDGESSYAYIKTNQKSLSDLIHTYEQERAAAREAAREAELAKLKALKGTAPEGRVAVKGKIVMIKDVQGQSFSYYDSGITTKMLVELGNKSTVWGTLPSKIYDAEKGDTVEFTATFEHAEGDHTHAFFKRPSKTSILERAETA